MGEGRWLCTLWSPEVLRLVRAPRGDGSIADTLTGLIGGVVEQRSNIVNKKRVKKLGDLFLVREIQRAVKRDPTCQSAVSRRATAPSEPTRHLSDALDQS